MNIHLSDRSTKLIEAAIGTSDPVVVTQIVERLISDKQLVQSFVLEPQTADELEESLAMCDQGIRELEDGKTEPAKEALREIAVEFGLKLEK